jgi:hypothetical protein
MTISSSSCAARLHRCNAAVTGTTVQQVYVGGDFLAHGPNMDTHDLSSSDRLSKLVMAAFTGVAAYLLLAEHEAHAGWLLSIAMAAVVVLLYRSRRQESGSNAPPEKEFDAWQ